MSKENARYQSDDLTSEEIEEMRKYGVTRISRHGYQAGQYRYANLMDAVAEAKRETLRARTDE